MQQNIKRRELLELQNLVAEQRTTFIQALRTMQSSLTTWQNQYALRAPEKGTIYYSKFWQENQILKSGQEVFYLQGQGTVAYGEIFLAQQNLGKVRPGQTVLIRFESYPAEEFGLVKGRLAFISDVPSSNGTFLAQVVLPKGLTTTYGRQLTYKMGMTANASILTDNQRLSDKLVFGFRKALSR